MRATSEINNLRNIGNRSINNNNIFLETKNKVNKQYNYKHVTSTIESRHRLQACIQINAGRRRRLTGGLDLLAEHDQRVAAAVLLLDDDLVIGVEPLVVQPQPAAEVVHRHVAQRLHALLVAHRRLGAVQQQRPLADGGRTTPPIYIYRIKIFVPQNNFFLFFQFDLICVLAIVFTSTKWGGGGVR